MDLTKREQEFLRKIYELHEVGIQIVGPARLAKEFNMTRTSAYEILMSLVAKRCLLHHKKKGFSLSSYGMIIAKQIVRRHRVLEYFMFSVLKIDLKKACEYAKKIDLDAPEEFIDSLDKLIGEPKCCPHGKLIPREV